MNSRKPLFHNSPEPKKQRTRNLYTLENNTNTKFSISIDNPLKLRPSDAISILNMQYKVHNNRPRISPQEFIKLWVKNEGKCSLTKRELLSNNIFDIGIEQIDHWKPFTIDNCRLISLYLLESKLLTRLYKLVISSTTIPDIVGSFRYNDISKAVYTLFIELLESNETAKKYDFYVSPIHSSQLYVRFIKPQTVHFPISSDTILLNTQTHNAHATILQICSYQDTATIRLSGCKLKNNNEIRYEEEIINLYDTSEDLVHVFNTAIDESMNSGFSSYVHLCSGN